MKKWMNEWIMDKWMSEWIKDSPIVEGNALGIYPNSVHASYT